MLVVKNEEYLAAVRAFADAKGIRADLEERLDWLQRYGGAPAGSDAIRVTLYKDFAPQSFAFVIESKIIDAELREADLAAGGDGYRVWFNGGLIFHPGATGPDTSLSVELSPSDKPHWSIHT